MVTSSEQTITKQGHMQAYLARDAICPWLSAALQAASVIFEVVLIWELEVVFELSKQKEVGRM